jgi:WD40 repeat protein
VVDLCAASGAPGLLLSLARDGELRLWDCGRGACLAALPSDAAAAALHPSGRHVVTASRSGRLSCWDLALEADAPSGGDAPGCLTSRWTLAGRPPVASDAGLDGPSAAVAPGCLRFLPGDRLVALSADGRLHTWAWGARAHAATWRVPGAAPPGGGPAHASLGSSPDGACLCVGSATGDVFVFETASGERLAHVSAAPRVSGPVAACALSDDCRHLLAAAGNGYVLRFEAQDDPAGGAGGE